MTDYQSQPSAEIDETRFGSYRKILLLSGPLVISQMGVMLMQIVDGLFLANYSEATIAAVGPSGLSFWLVCGFFIGVVGYTNTFVAQYVGAKRSERVGPAVWQGIYLALASGAILAACALGSNLFFNTAGHAAEIRAQEIIYFDILCYGGVAFMLSAALSGFYSGRHDNVSLMVAHISGGVLNAVLDYAMIFGKWGFPEMGMAGAAWATVAGTSLQVLVLGALLFRPKFLKEFGTWRDRGLDWELLKRMCIYGLPNGVRFTVEILVWTVFLLLMGRIDSDGLAASNIVWRINGMAFFPVIGLSIAVSMLVGQAQGAGRPDLSRKVTLRGLVLAQIWMVSAALLMVLFPHALLAPFFKESAPRPELVAMCVKLFWFVAAYCMLDGVNIILMSMLTGAGDTKWMLIVSGSIHLTFLLILVALATLFPGVFIMWTAATLFVCTVAAAWVIRFRSGGWRTKRVIEAGLPELVSPAVQLPAANLPIE